MEAPATEAPEEVQEVTVAEEAEEANNDQVRTVEAEDDHEEPKSKV